MMEDPLRQGPPSSLGLSATQNRIRFPSEPWLDCWVGTMFRVDSRLVPSQWETSLQSNAVSHRLGANIESARMLLTQDYVKYKSSVNRKYNAKINNTVLISKTKLNTNLYVHVHACVRHRHTSKHLHIQMLQNTICSERTAFHMHIHWLLRWYNMHLRHDLILTRNINRNAYHHIATWVPFTSMD